MTREELGITETGEAYIMALVDYYGNCRLAKYEEQARRQLAGLRKKLDKAREAVRREYQKLHAR